MIEFYSLDAYTIIESSSLSLNRSNKLANAVSRNSDYELLKCYRYNPISRFSPSANVSAINYFFAEANSEILILDVINQSIPLRNAAGIYPRERLAFVVPTDSRRLVTVYPLRKNFPKLLHSNVAPHGYPYSLCLYNQAPLTVSAHWTAERMLSLVQWWLEESASKTLHGIDQPPEQLFINTGHELLIPNYLNVDILRDSQRCWVISHVAVRQEKYCTLRLEDIPKSQQHNNEYSLLWIDLGEFDHRPIAWYPTTLGDLEQLCSDIGIDLENKLATAITSQFDTLLIGKNKNPNHKGCIILLNMKIRANSILTEYRYGLLLNINVHQLGDELGALFKNPENSSEFFPALPQTQINSQPIAIASPDLWTKHEVQLVEVLPLANTNDFRHLSGGSRSGPRALLVGAGALGSELLQLWIRGGWGQWAVVDHDHLRPHNLARHAGYIPFLGMNKADSLSELVSLINDSIKPIQAFNEDACGSWSPQLEAEMVNAELVVDATAGTDFPRSIGLSDDVKRLASVFVTPDGNGAVLMIEDQGRSIRINAIEAQYYRALISSEWGKNHLARVNGTVRSGLGCRDISLQLAHTRIIGHAATLAEQIQLLETESDAFLRVWNRKPECGSVQMDEVPLYPVITCKESGFNVVYDVGLIEKLRNFRKISLENTASETGGVLYGYVDFNIMTIFLVDASPAPADSQATSTSFIRGRGGEFEEYERIKRLTLNQVSYVGEWHSHPDGCSAKHSSVDLKQINILAEYMIQEGLPVITLVIGDPKCGNETQVKVRWSQNE